MDAVGLKSKINFKKKHSIKKYNSKSSRNIFARHVFYFRRVHPTRQRLYQSLLHVLLLLLLYYYYTTTTTSRLSSSEGSAQSADDEEQKIT